MRVLLLYAPTLHPMKKLFPVLFLFLLISACESEDSQPGPSSPGNNYYNTLSYAADGYSTGEGIAGPGLTGERYNTYVENPFVEVAEEPVSTFSIDADGASYANFRRFLHYNQAPPAEAIRTEEFINYFPYDYPEPVGTSPIGLNGEVSLCPWKEGNRLIRIGIKGKTITRQSLPAANWVLLVDVSGSMSDPDKLALIQQGLTLFVDQMRSDDKLALVTYAGSAGVVLDATPGHEKDRIKQAINALSSGGSTAGAEGIITAYDIAEANFIEGGNNRVILATDGDFNVGPSSQEELITLIEKKRESGIFLTVLGVGTGNLNEGAMEQIANHGNGTFEYLDNLTQCEKVFVHEYGKFTTVAKDVKVQVQFNPEAVTAYRLIGYENRLLEQEDFEDDTKDAGEIGSGQAITALYEVVPNAAKSGIALRQIPTFTIDFRYKEPHEDQGQPLQLEIYDQGAAFDNASENLRFAASVTGLAMLLMDSQYQGDLTYAHVSQWAEQARQYDPHGFRQEFIRLVDQVQNF